MGGIDNAKSDPGAQVLKSLTSALDHARRAVCQEQLHS